ncbi:MAG: COX15/CtaA family protein [Ramlibacter sp.]|nr:COX15/CtaA family protein [Ramlibacter sp.]
MQASLVDLTPALRLMLLGIAVAIGPLAWVWLRNRRAAPARRLQALTLLTLFLTFDLVLFGAFTRLTDSGLGCPDWPGCYGSASPAGAQQQIDQAQAALPTGPVTQGKAWIEMIHRYLATGVGVLILTLALSTWVLRKRAVVIGLALPLVTLAWVCLQGAFGALTVTMKLFPAIVTLHLLGGLGLLALLTVQSAAYARANGMAPIVVDRATRALLLLAFAMVTLQTALGGWVSTNYAVLACNTFPSCQGGWWPVMDFRQGFELWRELGRTGAGEPINFAALTAIHYVHRLGAYVVIVLLSVLAWRLRQTQALRKYALWLVGLALWQVATGITNVVMDWPLAAAVSHTGGAAALVVALTWTCCRVRPASRSRAIPSLAGSGAPA